MPVIPSFSAFAKGPDLAQAYLGAQRIAQQGQEAAARIGVEREKIAQDQAQAQLSFTLKQQQLDQDHLADQQRIEVSKQYHQIQAGLKEQQLAQAEQAMQAKAMQAAKSYEAGQKYQQLFQSGGGTPDAAMKAALAAGPGLGAGFPAAMRMSGAGSASQGVGEITHPVGRPDLDMLKRGPNSFGIVPGVPKDLSKEEAKDVPGLPGKKLIGNRLVTAGVDPQQKLVADELKSLMALHRKDDKGETAKAKKDEGKRELGPAQQDDLTRYEAREKKIEALKKKINAGPGAARATLPAGMGGGTSTAKRFRWDPKLNKPVPVGD